MHPEPAEEDEMGMGAKLEVTDRCRGRVAEVPPSRKDASARPTRDLDRGPAPSTSTVLPQLSKPRSRD
jgi:hypothetical protein